MSLVRISDRVPVAAGASTNVPVKTATLLPRIFPGSLHSVMQPAVPTSALDLPLSSCHSFGTHSECEGAAPIKGPKPPGRHRPLNPVTYALPAQDRSERQV